MGAPTKTIVVLGASYVGLHVTHKLLQKTLNTEKDYKLILVSPNTHQYWNPASVRAVVPGLVKDEEIFQDIRPALQDYPTDQFQHIIGAATKLSPSTKTVTINPTGSQEILQNYDILVIATGSKSAAPGPWKNSLKGYEDSVKTLHETQAAVAKAKTIVVGGGGATGVETAAEIKYEYGAKKEVTLITGGSRLVSDTAPQNVVNFITNEFKKMKIPVVLNTKITSSNTLPSGETELTLSNGEKKVVDYYLPTVGLISNTEFVPKELLDEKGQLIVDEFFRVKGVEDIWAAGDAGNTEPNLLVYAQFQRPILVANLDSYIKGQSLKAYKANPPMIFVTTGRSKGTAHYDGWKLPSLMVWFAKGRTLFLENNKPLVAGKT